MKTTLESFNVTAEEMVHKVVLIERGRHIFNRCNLSYVTFYGSVKDVTMSVVSERMANKLIDLNPMITVVTGKEY